MTSDKTENRDYNLPAENSTDWHVPLNENWKQIDADVQAALDMAQKALDAASGGTEETTGDRTVGFSWDQTSVDTSWLADADANDNLNVETVTSLDLTGPGSITEAIQNGGSQPTVVVFEVGGVIDIGGGPYWRVKEPNTYIAGQTAPYPGISFVRGGIRVHDRNFIAQHLGFFCGDDVNDPYKAGAVTMNDASNMLFDHCTAAWAPDTNIRGPQGGGPHAFINGINSEALNDSSHPEAPHGYAINIRFDGQWDFLGNLQSHNWKRNIRGGQNGINFAYHNNYIWNWGKRLFHGGGDDPGLTLDWSSCVMEDGQDTYLSTSGGDRGGLFDNRTVQCYFEDNDYPSEMPALDSNVEYLSDPVNLPDGLSLADLKSPSELESFLTPVVGPRPADRAPHEQRIVDDFTTRSGRIIDHHSEVGGYPDYGSNTRSLSPPDSGVLDWLTQFTEEVELGA